MSVCLKAAKIKSLAYLGCLAKRAILPSLLLYASPLLGKHLRPLSVDQSLRRSGFGAVGERKGVYHTTVAQ